MGYEGSEHGIPPVGARYILDGDKVPKQRTLANCSSRKEKRALASRSWQFVEPIEVAWHTSARTIVKLAGGGLGVGPDPIPPPRRQIGPIARGEACIFCAAPRPSSAADDGSADSGFVCVKCERKEAMGRKAAKLLSRKDGNVSTGNGPALASQSELVAPSAVAEHSSPMSWREDGPPGTKAEEEQMQSEKELRRHFDELDEKLRMRQEAAWMALKKAEAAFNSARDERSKARKLFDFAMSLQKRQRKSVERTRAAMREENKEQMNRERASKAEELGRLKEKNAALREDLYNATEFQILRDFDESVAAMWKRKQEPKDDALPPPRVDSEQPGMRVDGSDPKGGDSSKKRIVAVLGGARYPARHSVEFKPSVSPVLNASTANNSDELGSDIEREPGAQSNTHSGGASATNPVALSDTKKRKASESCDILEIVRGEGGDMDGGRDSKRPCLEVLQQSPVVVPATHEGRRDTGNEAVVCAPSTDRDVQENEIPGSLRPSEEPETSRRAHLNGEPQSPPPSTFTTGNGAGVVDKAGGASANVDVMLLSSQTRAQPIVRPDSQTLGVRAVLPVADSTVTGKDAVVQKNAGSPPSVRAGSANPRPFFYGAPKPTHRPRKRTR